MDLGPKRVKAASNYLLMLSFLRAYRRQIISLSHIVSLKKEYVLQKFSDVHQYRLRTRGTLTNSELKSDLIECLLQVGADDLLTDIFVD